MEILRRGQPKSEKVATFICLHCQSTLKAQWSEGKYFSDQREGDAIIFTCPVCRNEIYVDVRRFQ